MEQGTVWVKEKYLADLTEGNLSATLCFNEIAAGSDLNSIETLAKYDPDTESYNLHVRFHLGTINSKLNMILCREPKSGCLTRPSLTCS